MALFIQRQGDMEVEISRLQAGVSLLSCSAQARGVILDTLFFTITYASWAQVMKTNEKVPLERFEVLGKHTRKQTHSCTVSHIDLIS